MGRMSSFFFGMVVGAAALFGAMHYYLVQSNDGFSFVAKLSPKLDNPYTDIRKFTLEDWQKRQDLALALLKANKGNLMQDSSLGGFKQAAQKTLEQLNGKQSGWTW